MIRRNLPRGPGSPPKPPQASSQRTRCQIHRRPTTPGPEHSPHRFELDRIPPTKFTVYPINLFFRMDRKLTPLGRPRRASQLDILPLDARSCSLGHPILSVTQGLAISKYSLQSPTKIRGCQIFQTLSSTSSLRTLIKIAVAIHPRLEPSTNPIQPRTTMSSRGGTRPLRRISRLTLVKKVSSRANNWSKRGAKHSSIAFVDPDGNGES